EAFVMAVFTTGKPQVSDVTLSRLNRQPVTGVGVPVMQGDQVRYVLVGVIPALETSPIFRRGDLPPSWVSGVIDRQGRYVISYKSPDRAADLPVIDDAFRRAI